LLTKIEKAQHLIAEAEKNVVRTGPAARDGGKSTGGKHMAFA